MLFRGLPYNSFHGNLASLAGRRTFRREIPLGLAAPDHTVPYGTALWGGSVPGTSCQATIAVSLRDISQQALARLSLQRRSPRRDISKIGLVRGGGFSRSCSAIISRWFQPPGAMQAAAAIIASWLCSFAGCAFGCLKGRSRAFRAACALPVGLRPGYDGRLPLLSVYAP